ncbi:uncharacterized protein SCHCODRAFT_02205762 [Schizophyllum commune H4-8]|uniref:uncharacterized protein n=1 Tax=Schizophyllum commune (strain H4-8 / FGSC 9210) TaxID=578458 RepID=UPI00215DD816|nr:uncharacterized protein SCHCODRAFT_02205762 [Schizophyllum commune H4-8]KAI5897066.1 hypothetical protein SCHCODRAFT_02205762 [Schizophyllum commune H4-8]
MPISSELAILLSEALAVDDSKRITARVFGHKLVQVERLYNSTVKETGTPSWLAEEDTTAVWAKQAPQPKRPSQQRPAPPQKMVAPQPRRNGFLAVPKPQAAPQARRRSPSPVGARSSSPAGPRSISPAGLRSTSPAGPRRAPLPAAPKKATTTSKKAHLPVTPRKAPATRKVVPAQSPAGPRKARPAPTPIQAPIMPAPPAPLPFFADYRRAPTIKYHDIPAAYLDISAYIRASTTDDMYIPTAVDAAPTHAPINVRPSLAPIVTRPMPLPPMAAFAAPSPIDAYHPILDIADYLYAPSPVDLAPSPTEYGPSPISATPSPTRKRFLPIPPLPTPPALPDLAYNISTHESAMPVTPGAERDTMDIPTLAPDLKKQQVIAEAKRALAVPPERILVIPDGAKQTLKMLGAQQATVVPPRAVKLVRREVARAVPLKVEVSVC